MIATALLIAAIACFHAFLRGYGGSRIRRRFARRAVRHWLWFGMPALLMLASLGRIEALAGLPPEFVPARIALARLIGGTLAPGDLLRVTAIGVVSGGVVLALVERRRRRPLGVGDIEAVLPRTRRELPWGVLTSISAGVSEELFFRLLIPLLVAGVLGSAVPGFAVATALFGWAHRYQGRIGMVATASAGASLAAAYLLTGAFWIAVALHVVIDLNALVLRPALSGRLRAQA
ncbi:CPBP family intramembrane glutamic endopeptidase [Sphingomonas adhaesiva]|uniref:CPBP family intramembrane glutamic endopeptidase n=1 Tax=Sphingomonas adhaesiva TaxID=28212 RepID=UPI002FF94952